MNGEKSNFEYFYHCECSQQAVMWRQHARSSNEPGQARPKHSRQGENICGVQKIFGMAGSYLVSGYNCQKHSWTNLFEHLCPARLLTRPSLALQQHGPGQNILYQPEVCYKKLRAALMTRTLQCVLLTSDKLSCGWPLTKTIGTYNHYFMTANYISRSP